MKEAEKKQYEKAEMEVIFFDSEDIITTSGDINQEPWELPIVGV